jgi:hypothetical protein
MGGHVFWPRHVERAAKRFGKAGTRTGYYDGFSHFGRWSLVVGKKSIGWSNRLSGCNFLFIEVGEGAAFRRQLFQEGRRFP